VAEMTENHGKASELKNFVKPRASLEDISNTAREDVSKLTTRDVIVVWEEQYDIGKMLQEIVLNILQIL
jgi:hypothetical protein